MKMIINNAGINSVMSMKMDPSKSQNSSAHFAEEIEKFKKNPPRFEELTLDRFNELNSGNRELTASERVSVGRFLASDKGVAELALDIGLKSGEVKDIKHIVRVGEDLLSFGFTGSFQTPNKYVSSIDNNSFDKTLQNLYDKFGKGNVTIQTFDKLSSPTRAEFSEMKTGRDYYQIIQDSYLASVNKYGADDSPVGGKVNTTR
jgi:hypothetical protein